MNLAVIHVAVATKLYTKRHRVVTVSFKVCGSSLPKLASRIRVDHAGLRGHEGARRGPLMRSRDEVLQTLVRPRNEPDRNMNTGLEPISALTTAWLSLLFIAASVFGSICALGAAWAARWFIRQPASAPPARWPDVSILKPLYGAEAQLSENIETYFHQDYPGKIQFVFGVQDPNDSAIPVVKSLIERYPQLDLHLDRQRRRAWRQS